MPTKDALLGKWEAWCRCGSLVGEMETAALFSVVITRRLRVGAVLLCIWNQEREKAGCPHEECFDTTRPIRVAVHALKLLIGEESGKTIPGSSRT